ncbi:MAG: MFS transporter, partial [Actinomycetes bacterium]
MPSRRRAWFVWAGAVVAYGVAVLERTSLGVAAGPAAERFGFNASTFAFLAVVQLVTYAGLQVPVGVLLDRYGSRRLLVVGAMLMAGGQTLLALAENAPVAVAARVLVGAGDAMTFTCVLRLLPAWFPARRVPLLTQVTGQVGQLGQVASTVPLVAALAGVGWTASYLGAAAIALVSAVLVGLVVRDRPAGTPNPGSGLTLREANRNVVTSFLLPGTRLGLWTHFTTQFSGLVFVLLWGFPFVTTGLGYSSAFAGSLLTLMVLAGVAIGPALGQLSARFPMRRSNLVFGVLVVTVGMWTLVL